MSVIKQLIIKEWYRFFIGAAFVLFLLVSVGNLVSGFLRGNVTPSEVMLNYLLELPRYFGMIFPVSCLVASLFSINKLKNRNELTAIFASGYSRKKFVLNIVQASLLIGAAQFLISSYVQPFAKENRHLLIKNGESKFRNLKGQGLRASTIGSGKVWYKSRDYYFSFATFNKQTNTLHDVELYFFDHNYKLKRQIKAKSLVHQKDNYWMLHDGTIFDKLNGTVFSSTQNFTKHLQKIDETPADFKQIEADVTTLNVISLWKYIKRLSDSGINANEYLIIFLDKFSSSIICIVFALIASIAIFNPNRRTSSFGKNVAFILIFTLVYWFVYTYSLELGKSSKVPPIIACFTVPILFTFFLVYYFSKNRQLR